MTIIDRRKQDTGKQVSNRQKFIQRYKKLLQKKVMDIAQKGNMKSLGKTRHVKISKDDIKEPVIGVDNSGGWDYVFPGNDGFDKGDTIPKPQADRSGNKKGGEDDGQGEDFYFTLTKQEFMDLFFADLGLPNFIKESIDKVSKKVRQRSGYSKDGIPARLDLKKTFEMSVARRTSARAQGNTHPPFLDDIDLRYRYYTMKPKPIRKAVMFCVMDLSGSMSAERRERAKLFFLLLNPTLLCLRNLSSTTTPLSFLLFRLFL